MTGDREPQAPGPAPAGPDPLAGVLNLARKEALEGEDLEAFVTGLRERAGRVIAERLGPVETKLRALEGENQWQKEAIASLEAEAILQRGAIEDAGEEQRKASAAHESLLTHHRELMARLAGQLGEIASLSPLRAQEVRRRLRALADLLRADTR